MLTPTQRQQLLQNDAQGKTKRTMSQAEQKRIRHELNRALNSRSILARIFRQIRNAPRRIARVFARIILSPRAWRLRQGNKRKSLKETIVLETYLGKDDAQDWESSSDEEEDESIRPDKELHDFIKVMTESNWFQNFIMLCILINAVFLCLDTFRTLAFLQGFLSAVDEVFLAIYTLEFVFKIYAEPTQYWDSGFNIFDFAILVGSMAQELLSFVSTGTKGAQVFKVLRAFRTLRTLRSVSFSSTLQVLVVALLDTLAHNVLSVVFLVLLVMYLFALVGFNLFKGNQEYFGSLGMATLTLFSWVTIDGWTDVVIALEKSGWRNFGRAFAVAFVCVGHLLLTNIFVGIIILNVQETTTQNKKDITRERELAVKEKKDVIRRLQTNRVVKAEITFKDADFSSLAEEFERHLRHDDFVSTKTVLTNPAWINRLLLALKQMETTSENYTKLLEEMAAHLKIVLHHNAASGRLGTEFIDTKYDEHTPSKGEIEKALEKRKMLLKARRQSSLIRR